MSDTRSNAIVNGLFLGAGAGNQPPAADAGPDQTVADTDGDGQETVTLDGGGSSDPAGEIGSYVWTEGSTEIATGVRPDAILPVGPHAITLTVTDNNGAVDSATVNVTVEAGAGNASAVFATTDSATQGTWRGVYGADGYNVIREAESYPAYATVSSSGHGGYTWTTSSSEVRALQKVEGTERIAACWYSAGTFEVDLDLTDGATHRLAVYCMDFDNHGGGREQEMSMLDAASGAVLDTRTAASFQQGIYWMWDLRGHVKLRVRNVNTRSNAIVNGLFFGTAGNRPPVAVLTAEPNPAQLDLPVLLDSRASYDPDDGDDLVKELVQIGSGAPAVDLTDLGDGTFQFTPTEHATYQFQLTVSDGALSHVATVSVTIFDSNPPTIKLTSVTFSGTVDGTGSAVKDNMRVGDRPAGLIATGDPHVSNWQSEELPTPEQSNAFEVYAEDEAGNTTRSTITLAIDP